MNGDEKEDAEALRLLTVGSEESGLALHTYYPAHIAPSHPLLPGFVAHLVSVFAAGSRHSLQFAQMFLGSMFELLKITTATSLGISRRAVVQAVSSARNIHQLTISNISNQSEPSSFFKVLDLYTNVGVSLVHNSFCLAELLTLCTFQLTANTIKLSLETAEEIVLIFDGLFGDTDTSKALAAGI